MLDTPHSPISTMIIRIYSKIWAHRMNKKGTGQNSRKLLWLLCKTSDEHTATLNEMHLLTNSQRANQYVQVGQSRAFRHRLQQELQ